MGFDQYHEPAGELSQEIRTFARVIASLKEESEAIGWYQQRISIEQDPDAKKIMEHAQEEEFLHFSMDLEFLLRRTPKWGRWDEPPDSPRTLDGEDASSTAPEHAEETPQAEERQ